jgi:hypothetical protein
MRVFAPRNWLLGVPKSKQELDPLSTGRLPESHHSDRAFSKYLEVGGCRRK